MPIKSRIITSVLACLLVTAPAALAGPTPPPPQFPILIFAGTPDGCYFLGDPWKVALGDPGPKFSNNDTTVHIVMADTAMWQLSIGGGGEKLARIEAAGTHTAICDPHLGDAAQVVARVKPETSSAPAGVDFTVRWASDRAGDAWRYEVQYKRGSGDWRTWFGHTSKEAARFDAKASQRYLFRVRTTNPGEGVTGWSPTVSFTT